MLGGYQQDRPEALLADTACSVLGLRRDSAGQPMLIHDCAGTRGSSGAPVLAQGPDGGWARGGDRLDRRGREGDGRRGAGGAAAAVRRVIARR